MQLTDVEKIVTAYGAILAESTAIGLVRDINSLPYSKEEIKSALKIALGTTTDASMGQHLKTAYVSLADFQELSDAQIKSLQHWNSAQQSVAVTNNDIEKTAEILSNVGKDVVEIQQRVAAEAGTLAQELKTAGF